MALITLAPVELNTFPALPIVTVRSHIPGRVANKKKINNYTDICRYNYMS